ncbi:hypothetical protein O181_001403 [Austropuccinia psidii MF-1]|uniref:DUF4939 domain-containing protein n=1 Tax=Austropuccinia psidii MF-1 TaxID=1389203 RepID=A0A9Q3BAG1_9BASI|nr:hypothetical protein [Austropuccinia psidii MF-1]
MPVQHPSPARQTRSHSRAQAVVTPNPRAPSDGSPAVPQLRAHLDRGPILEGAEPSRKEVIGPRRSSSFSGVVSGTGGPTLAQSHQSEPSLLAIMQQMTQIMTNLQAASFSEASRPPAFKTLSMKAPEYFDGTLNVRSFMQSFQLIFHNYPENISQDRKKVLYTTSFLIARASKWIEPYLSNLTNQDPSKLPSQFKVLVLISTL